MSISLMVEVIEQLVAVHLELLVLAQAKTPVLVNNYVNELNAIVSKETKLVRKLDELDKLRIQTTGEYLISRGYLPDPRITISDIVKIVFKADEKKQLLDLQKTLLDHITELRKRNEVNQQLIQQSLSFIDFSLDLLVETPGEDVFYQNPAQSNLMPTRSGLFDTKA